MPEHLVVLRPSALPCFGSLLGNWQWQPMDLFHLLRGCKAQHHPPVNYLEANKRKEKRWGKKSVGFFFLSPPGFSDSTGSLIPRARFLSHRSRAGTAGLSCSSLSLISMGFNCPEIVSIAFPHFSANLGCKQGGRRAQPGPGQGLKCHCCCHQPSPTVSL